MSLRDDLRDLVKCLYHDADMLDRETGDDTEDLIRAGRQSATISIANELQDLLDGGCDCEEFDE
jgi:hypothetical protein